MQQLHGACRKANSGLPHTDYRRRPKNDRPLAPEENILSLGKKFHKLTRAKRRHLTPSQLGCVGALAEPMYAAEAKKRMAQAPGKPQGTKKAPVEKIPQETGKARDQAAKAVSVNPRYEALRRMKGSQPRGKHRSLPQNSNEDAWSQKQTANALDISRQQVGKCLAVAAAVREHGMTLQKIAGAAGVSVGTVHGAVKDKVFNSEKLPGADGKLYPSHYAPRRQSPEWLNNPATWHAGSDYSGDGQAGRAVGGDRAGAGG